MNTFRGNPSDVPFRTNLLITALLLRLVSLAGSKRGQRLENEPKVLEQTTATELRRCEALSFSGDSSVFGKMVAVMIGFGAVLSLFLIVPLIHMVDLEHSKSVFEEAIVMRLPPPSVPRMAQPHQTVAEKKPPVPKLDEALPKLNVSMFELALSPSMDDPDASLEDSSLLEDLLQDIRDYDRIFDFDDLANAPSIVALPEIHYPKELIRKNILKGKVVVVVLIDEQGFAHCEEILASTHPLLTELARDVVSKTRFAISYVDGEAVRVRGNWPIMLRAP